MIVEHRGRTPRIDPSATVAPGAIVSGDVVVESGARILHGAVLTAEDGEVRIGRESVVLEHAVIRGRAGHPAVVGSHVMVGPHAHVNGATVGDRAFIATGASLFPGAVVGERAEVRVNGVVQVNTALEPGAVVPIGWVAVGSPARILPRPARGDLGHPAGARLPGHGLRRRSRRGHGRAHASAVGVLLGPRRRPGDRRARLARLGARRRVVRDAMHQPRHAPRGGGVGARRRCAGSGTAHRPPDRRRRPAPEST